MSDEEGEFTLDTEEQFRADLRGLKKTVEEICYERREGEALELAKLAGRIDDLIGSIVSEDILERKRIAVIKSAAAVGEFAQLVNKDLEKLRQKVRVESERFMEVAGKALDAKPMNDEMRNYLKQKEILKQDDLTEMCNEVDLDVEVIERMSKAFEKTAPLEDFIEKCEELRRNFTEEKIPRAWTKEQKEVRILKQKLEERDKDCDTLRNRVERLTNESKTQKDDIRNNRKEKERLEQENERLKRQIEDERRDKDRIRRDIDAMRREREDMEREMDEMRKQLAQKEEGRDQGRQMPVEPVDPQSLDRDDSSDSEEVKKSGKKGKDDKKEKKKKEKELEKEREKQRELEKKREKEQKESERKRQKDLDKEEQKKQEKNHGKGKRGEDAKPAPEHEEPDSRKDTKEHRVEGQVEAAKSPPPEEPKQPQQVPEEKRPAPEPVPQEPKAETALPATDAPKKPSGQGKGERTIVQANTGPAKLQVRGQKPRPTSNNPANRGRPSKGKG